MYFVPEGQPDSSQVRSAWIPIQKHPRPQGTVEVIVSPIVSPRDIYRRNRAHAASETLGIIGSIVPLGRDYFPHDPGTSCLATIRLSLRDKTHSPLERLPLS
jgi:hypothetical protein